MSSLKKEIALWMHKNLDADILVICGTD